MQNDGSIIVSSDGRAANNFDDLSPVKQFFRNKWVRAILIIDVIAIIAVIGVIIYNSTKTATINFSVAPLDATIRLNGNGDYANGTYQIHPGTYQVEISHDSLETKTFDLELKSGYVTTLATFLAGPDNNFDFYTLKDNYSSYEKLASIASEGDNQTTDQDPSAYQFIKKTTKILSISDILPIKGYVHADPLMSSSTAGFAIRDGKGMEGCDKIACLLVNYYGSGYEESVARKIEEAGYSPADYQILYERYN